MDVVIDPVDGLHTEPAPRATGHFGCYGVIGFASGTIADIPLNQERGGRPHRPDGGGQVRPRPVWPRPRAESTAQAAGTCDGTGTPAWV